MTQALQKYSGFELDDKEELDKEMSKGSSDWMKIKVGKNVVRFLPAPVGQKPFVLVREHQLNIGDKFINFACPKLMAKKPCAVCVKIDQLKTTGNPADYERAESWFPRKRIYSHCIDRAQPEIGPKVYAFGVKIWEQLSEIREDEDFGGDFTHPVTGFDVIIKRKGSTMNDTKYICKPTKQSELGNEDWLEQVGDLSRFAKLLTADEMRAKIGGSKDKAPAQEKPEDDMIIDAEFDKPDDDDDDTPF